VDAITSAKRIPAQIPTSQGDAIEAWVHRHPKEILLAAVALMSFAAATG
jgi:hypothetical protein